MRQRALSSQLPIGAETRIATGTEPASKTAAEIPAEAAAEPGKEAGLGKRIAGNFGLLTLFKVLSDGFTFGLFVVLSRTFGEAGIGAYSFAVGIGSGFATLADFGLYRLSIKDLARRDDDFGAELSAINGLRWALTVVSLVVLGLAALLLPIDHEIRPVLFIVGVHLLLYGIANGLGAVFIARQEVFLAAKLDFGGKALAALAGIGLAAAGFDLPTVLWALPASTALQVAAASALVRRKYHPPRSRPEELLGSPLWRESLPFFSSTLVRYITIRSDVVLLGFLRGAAAAGIYNVAYRVVFLMMYVPYYAALAVFPIISRLHHRRSSDAHELIQASLGWMILIGIPASAGLLLIAQPLIDLVFGPRFERSAIILQLLAWLFFLSCLRNMLSTVQTACDQQAQRTRLETWAAILAVGGNLVLIGRYGPVGAAVAVLVAEAVLVVMTVIATRQMLDLTFLASRMVISALGSLAFLVPAMLLPGIPLFGVIAAAAVIYIAVVLSFPTIRRHELPAIASMRGQRGRPPVDSPVAD